MNTRKTQPAAPAHGRRQASRSHIDAVTHGAIRLAGRPAAVPDRVVPAVRPDAAIGYLLDGFPEPGACEIIEEIAELNRCGVQVHVFVVEPDGVSVDDPWLGLRRNARTDYAPAASSFLTPPVAAGRGTQGQRLQFSSTRSPAGATVIGFGTKPAPASPVEMHARWIAGQAAARGIGHLHAQMGTAEVARAIKRLTGTSFSFTAAGGDLGAASADDPVLREQIREAEFVVAPSDVSRKKLVSAVGAHLARHIHRIYHGLDLDRLRFHGEEGRDPNAVLCVAPLAEGSGVADLIEAAALLRERRPAGVRLTIIGKGPLESTLRERITVLGLDGSINLLPPATRTRLTALMRVHAVMAMPYGQFPGLPGNGAPPVLLEAMAVGLPVVSTIVVGVAEILEDGWTGRLVPPHSPAGLAGALETMLDNIQVRSRMAKAARAKIERHFAMSRNVSYLAGLFANATADSNIST
jgi:glycosyltransferase involved in cell wall biosynthesis